MTTQPHSASGDQLSAQSTSPRVLQATFNGQPIEALPGQSIAAALMASGYHSWRATKSGAQRGLFCGIGVCFDCLVEVDGESGQRACMIPLTEGMQVSSARGASTTGAEPSDRGAEA